MPHPPAEDLAKAQAMIDALREQLQRLFDNIHDGSNIALRFEAGEEQ